MTPVTENQVRVAKETLSAQNDLIARQVNTRDNLLGVYRLSMGETIFEQQRMIGEEEKMIEIKAGDKGALVAVVANWNHEVAPSDPKPVKVVGHQMMVEISSTQVIYLTPSPKGLILQEGEPKHIARGIWSDSKIKIRHYFFKMNQVGSS